MSDIEPMGWDVVCEEEYKESHNSCKDYDNIDI